MEEAKTEFFFNANNQLFRRQIMSGFIIFGSRRAKQESAALDSSLPFSNYPSCPKSLVKSSNFFRSAEFTVGLEVASDRSMSVYKKKMQRKQFQCYRE